MKITILGAYQTKFGELWDKSLKDLSSEAAFGAVEDAGVLFKDIQTAYFGNKMSPQITGQNHVGSLLAEILGTDIPITRIEAACASGGSAVRQACMAIESGQYETALVLGAEKMTDLAISEISVGLMGAASEQERESGLSFVGLYALMARKYFDKYGAGEKDLAAIAVKNHFHGSLNPKAQFPFVLTIDQVMASSMVADPLKLLDCSPITDGAAGLVLASEKYAKKLGSKKPVIIASKQASDTLSLSKRKDLTSLAGAEKAAGEAYRQAGVEAKDIEFAEVHDCFTIAEAMALEDLGFCKKGEGYIAVGKGKTRLGGERAINLSGGLKACGHPVGATGVKQLVEVYSQMMGRAGKRQTKKNKLALTHNIGGTGGTAVIHIVKN